ncbi:LiaI-LiaF-like domain-containing protein [Clostridium aciditolerans]|uniref:LiaI-LiaF-like transmembrane region domain-containing protein n=1 Tax=Clostridium aciditolerans TaxID=339861 RepID=A0A934HQX9_9CLOT|nr:DUF5668 domain-containing protein [Clostridium aciditolerans]MBI6872690.1 hypothetical protein [Clostridium aciditolerans]
MQSRRVGTLTLGIVLISIGVIFFLSTFFNLSFEKEILKFWPLILISLGIEILVLNSLAVRQKLYVKYDLISLFLIVVVLFLSFGTYAFSNFVLSKSFYHQIM